MSQYSAEVPKNDLVKPEIKSYYENFYAVSDTPDAHEKYASLFTKDARLIMASKGVSGRDEILEMRKGMWEKVAKRSHKPEKIFSFGAGKDEVMLFGTVDYELKDGKKTTVEWSARAVFAEEDGDLKMSFYQVYLSSFVHQNFATSQPAPHITDQHRDANTAPTTHTHDDVTASHHHHIQHTPAQRAKAHMATMPRVGVVGGAFCVLGAVGSLLGLLGKQTTTTPPPPSTPAAPSLPPPTTATYGPSPFLAVSNATMAPITMEMPDFPVPAPAISPLFSLLFALAMVLLACVSVYHKAAALRAVARAVYGAGEKLKVAFALASPFFSAANTCWSILDPAIEKLAPHTPQAAKDAITAAMTVVYMCYNLGATEMLAYRVVQLETKLRKLVRIYIKLRRDYLAESAALRGERDSARNRADREATRCQGLTLAFLYRVTAMQTAANIRERSLEFSRAAAFAAERLLEKLRARTMKAEFEAARSERRLVWTTNELRIALKQVEPERLRANTETKRVEALTIEALAQKTENERKDAEIKEVRAALVKLEELNQSQVEQIEELTKRPNELKKELEEKTEELNTLSAAAKLALESAVAHAEGAEEKQYKRDARYGQAAHLKIVREKDEELKGLRTALREARALVKTLTQQPMEELKQVKFELATANLELAGSMDEVKALEKTIADREEACKRTHRSKTAFRKRLETKIDEERARLEAKFEVEKKQFEMQVEEMKEQSHGHIADEERKLLEGRIEEMKEQFDGQVDEERKQFEIQLTEQKTSLLNLTCSVDKLTDMLCKAESNPEVPIEGPSEEPPAAMKAVFAVSLEVVKKLETTKKSETTLSRYNRNQKFLIAFLKTKWPGGAPGMEGPNGINHQCREYTIEVDRKNKAEAAARNQIAATASPNIAGPTKPTLALPTVTAGNDASAQALGGANGGNGVQTLAGPANIAGPTKPTLALPTKLTLALPTATANTGASAQALGGANGGNAAENPAGPANNIALVDPQLFAPAGGVVQAPVAHAGNANQQIVGPGEQNTTVQTPVQSTFGNAAKTPEYNFFGPPTTATSINASIHAQQAAEPGVQPNALAPQFNFFGPTANATGFNASTNAPQAAEPAAQPNAMGPPFNFFGPTANATGFNASTYAPQAAEPGAQPDAMVPQQALPGPVLVNAAGTAQAEEQNEDDAQAEEENGDNNNANAEDAAAVDKSPEERAIHNIIEIERELGEKNPNVYMTPEKKQQLRQERDQLISVLTREKKAFKETWDETFEKGRKRLGLW
ncbi:hypothetical protein LTR15_002888 [Elasticomyces elasticus]|nr:hypothetical protein LTR15_002888 [Elasticomyces elasticus]